MAKKKTNTFFLITPYFDVYIYVLDCTYPPPPLQSNLHQQVCRLRSQMRQNYATRLRPRVLQKHCIERAPRPSSYVVPALPIPTSYHFDGTFHPRHVITQQRRASWWGTREARRCSPACVLTHTVQSPALPASLRWRSSVSTVLGVQILQQRASIGKDFVF